MSRHADAQMLIDDWIYQDLTLDDANYKGLIEAVMDKLEQAKAEGIQEGLRMAREICEGKKDRYANYGNIHSSGACGDCAQAIEDKAKELL